MNYFKELGVNEHSSMNDIKKAFSKLALKHHPDQGGDVKAFIDIRSAYQHLLVHNSSTQNTNTDSNTKGNTYTNTKGNTYTNTNGNTYTNTNGNTNSNTNGNTYKNTNGNTYTNTNGNTNGNTYTNTNSNTNSNTYTNTNGNTYKNTNSNTYTNTNGNTNSNTNGNTYTNTNGNTYKNTNGNTYTNLNSNTCCKRGRSIVFKPSVFIYSLFGYVMLRHLLPKQDKVYDKRRWSDGALVRYYSVTNWLLFDKVVTWSDGLTPNDGHACAPHNSYFWRRINFIYKNKDNKQSRREGEGT